MMYSTPMLRLSLTLRALVLVPLLALGVDHARAAWPAGPAPRAAWRRPATAGSGVAGVVLLLVYAGGLALRDRPPRRRARAPGCCGCGCSAAPASPPCAAARRCSPPRSATAPRWAAAGSSCSRSASWPAPRWRSRCASRPRPPRSSARCGPPHRAPRARRSRLLGAARRHRRRLPARAVRAASPPGRGPPAPLD